MTPNVGDFGLVATYGNWRDRLAADAIRYGTDSPVNHAFVYVGDQQIVEAQPGGAVVSAWDRYANVTWSTGLIPVPMPYGEPIATAALALVGTPYGFADIIAVALAQKRLGAHVNSDTWWVRRIANRHTLICSQLVDVAYNTAGVRLFNDGRLSGLVTPGDLYRLLTPAQKAVS